MLGILISEVKIGNFAFLRKNKMVIIDTATTVFELVKKILCWIINRECKYCLYK